MGARGGASGNGEAAGGHRGQPSVLSWPVGERAEVPFVCLDPRPHLTPGTSLAEGAPAERPWSGLCRARARSTVCARAQGRRGDSPHPGRDGCTASLPALVSSPHCSLRPVHLSCVLKLEEGWARRPEPLPSWTDGDWPSTLLWSLLLVEPRLRRFTRGLQEAGRSCPHPGQRCSRRELGGTGAPCCVATLPGGKRGWSPSPCLLWEGWLCHLPQRAESQADLLLWGRPCAVGPGLAVERPRRAHTPNLQAACCLL